MYARLKTESYDVVIPSDYMVARLIDEDMLQPLNYDNIPNFSLIDEQYTHLAFDPEQQYSVPYTWGVVGMIYNTKYVDAARYRLMGSAVEREVCRTGGHV